MNQGARGRAPLPIIVGGDIGGYSVARAFHAAFGVRSVILAGALTGPVAHSRIADVRVTRHLEVDEVLAQAVAGVIEEHPDRAPIVMGAADWHVEAIVRLRSNWPLAAVPYVDAATLERATDKVAFGEACVASGVPYPETAVVGYDDVEPPQGLTYPVVCKAASTSAFHAVDYPGKSKVFYPESEEHLGRILAAARAGGYREPFLVQRIVKGSDSAMRVATCFVSQAGEVSDPVVGRVLLEEHTPGALGNPAVIVPGDYPDIVEAMTRLVAALGWSGHANFDVKWDEDTKTHVFFELNPRLGRSNFYQLAAGTNPAIALAGEFLGVGGAAPAAAKKRIYSILPAPLVWWYVGAATREGRELRRLVLRAALACRFAHPLWYAADPSPRRWFYIQAAKLNQYRKFARHYRVVGG